MTRGFTLPILAAATFSYAVWHVVSSSQTKPQTEPVVQPSRAPYANVLAGVGLLEPRSENIEVAAVVPGTVVHVTARVGVVVAPGDALFHLDDRRQKAELAVQEAKLVEAEAGLRRWERLPRTEDVPPSEARVERVRADLQLRLDQLERARRLSAQKVVTEQEIVEREQALNATSAELARAEAEDARLKAGPWEADLQVARAQVELSRQLVEQARTELARLVVRAPIGGTILKVDVRPGEYVGTPPDRALVVLGDLEEVHVRVDIDEHDLPRFVPGMPGRGFLRGDAPTPFPLRFVRVEPLAGPKRSLTGAGNERVDTRVLQVIYALEGTPRTGYVGQQMDVYLDASGSTSAAAGANADAGAAVHARADSRF